MQTELTEKKKEENLTEILNNIMQCGIYRGCIIYKLIGGFSIMGKKAKTIEEVDFIIDSAIEKLSDSIVK